MSQQRIFASQDPEDLLRDPLPFVDRLTGARQAQPGYLTTIHSPRPEFRLQLPHPTNRALVDMRYARRRDLIPGHVDPDIFYRGIVTVIDESDDYDLAEKEHAKLIAARLAAIS